MIIIVTNFFYHLEKKFSLAFQIAALSYIAQLFSLLRIHSR
jgi:hypothetical protein